MVIPFPVATSLDADDYVSVRNCKDHLGLFNVIPEFKLVNDANANLPDQNILKFQYKGKTKQRCMKFSLLYRLYYEGKEIRNCYRVFDYNGSKANGTTASVKIDNDSLIFTIIDKIENHLNAGIYFNVIKITDMSGQPYIDTNNFYRVKKNGSRNPPPNVHKDYKGPENTCPDFKEIDYKREMLLEYADYFTAKQ